MDLLYVIIWCLKKEILILIFYFISFSFKSYINGIYNISYIKLTKGKMSTLNKQSKLNILNLSIEKGFKIFKPN